MALVAVGGLALLGAGLAGALPGPVRPQLGAGPASLAAAAAINHGLSTRADDGERPSARLGLDGGWMRLTYQDGAAADRVLTCPWHSLPTSVDAYLAFARRPNRAPADCLAWDPRDPGTPLPAAGTGDVIVDIHELGASFLRLCPGVTTTLAELQIQQAVFPPALDLSGRGVLETPAAGFEACDGSRDTNCVVSRGAHFLYCGQLRDDARFRLRHGSQPVRAVDVAASAYYFRALAGARQARTVVPPPCDTRPTSVFFHALVSEVVTAETVDDFLRANPANPQVADFLRRHFASQAERRLCFFVPDTLTGGLATRGDSRLQSESLLLPERILSFPVVAPYDAIRPDEVGPLWTSIEESVRLRHKWPVRLAPLDLPARLGGSSPRDRIQRQLAAAFTEPNSGRPLTPVPASRLDRAYLAAHLAGAGPFVLEGFNQQAFELSADLPRPGPDGRIDRLRVRYRALWPEQLDDAMAACREDERLCLFRGLWTRRVGGRSEPLEVASMGQMPSMLGLFTRVEADHGCARALMAQLARLPDGDPTLGRLWAELLLPLGMEPPTHGWPSETRPGGLLPRSWLAELKQPAFERSAGRCSGELVLAYVRQQPWQRAAEQLQAMGQAAGLRVRLQAVDSAQLRDWEARATWDVLLTVAPHYTHHDVKTLYSLFFRGASNNLARGLPLHDEAPWRHYETLVVRAMPPWVERSMGAADPALLPRSRAEALAQLEWALFFGPAPMLPLAFVDPYGFAIGDRLDAEDGPRIERLTLEPFAFERLLEEVR